MRASITVPLIASLMASGCASAPDVIHGRTVQLHSEASADGETMDAFVVRIAPAAIVASQRARATICGQIEQVDGRFRLQLKTDGYVSDCALPRSGLTYVLVNGTATEARENHFSQLNWQRPGYLVTPWSVKHQDGINKRPRLVR